VPGEGAPDREFSSLHHEEFPSGNRGSAVAFVADNMIYYLLRRSYSGANRIDGPVAQLVEQRTENPRVASSTLAWATIFFTSAWRDTQVAEGAALLKL
jgi:hypothetical protein